MADPNSPPSGRAVSGGTAPDLRRPSQWWKAPPPGTPSRHPHSEQRRPARAHDPGPVLGPHARTDRTRDTRVAEAWLPAPEDGRPGEGQRLTPGAPHNGGRPPPPGTAFHHPRGMQPPQGMQAKGTVLGPHTHTPAPTAGAWRTPTAREVGEQSGEGQRLTSDGPHTMVESNSPGDASPPPPQRATPARKGARCGAGAGSPGPHRPHPGRTGRGTPAAHSRRRAAGGGTAPDTRHPSQQWEATPPGDGLSPPARHAAPTGHAGQGDSVGPPHPHTRTHSTWVADLNSPPSGRAVGGGGSPDPRRPSQQWKAPPPGTPFRHPQSPKPGRAEPGPDRPDPSTPDGARDRGRTRGRARTTWNGPTSAQCWDRAKCARHTTQGGGADAAGARAHTHTKGTWGLPEGQPDGARGTHRPRGMAYQRARVRDPRTGRPATRSAGHAGREGGNGRDTTPGTGPNPPNRPRAPRTHGRGTAAAKAVVAHCATPQPLG